MFFLEEGSASCCLVLQRQQTLPWKQIHLNFCPFLQRVREILPRPHQLQQCHTQHLLFISLKSIAPLPSTSNSLKAQLIFSSGCPLEVTCRASMNSLKSMVPLLLVSKV